MYVNNKEIISILNLLNKEPESKKYQKELYRMVKLMVDKNKYRREFIGHTRYFQDMESTAYYFFYLNLQKGNIRVKNTKIGDITNTTKYCTELPSQEILIKENINNKFYVRKIKKTSPPGRKVKTFDYLDDVLYEIDYVDIKYNDCFAYITSIITTSFWKVISPEKHEQRKHQMIFNFEMKNTDYVTTNDGLNNFDFTSDYEKNKVYEMMQEAIQYEKDLVEKKKGKLL